MHDAQGIDGNAAVPFDGITLRIPSVPGVGQREDRRIGSRLARAGGGFTVSGDLSKLSDDRLRTMLYQSRQMLSSLSESLEARPDMQNAIRRLMRHEDMMETFSELAMREPDLMRLVL